MRGYIGMTIVVTLAFAADHWFGAIGVTRFVGLLFLGACAYGWIVPSFKVHIGSTEIANLTGWKKAIALVPLSTFSLMVVFYAPAITCVSSKYKHLCA
jgi:hypothetical protein